MTIEPTNREAAAAARRAADIIQARGKSTGTAEDAAGRVCTHHALTIASARNRQTWAPIFLRLKVHASPLSVTEWSDLPTTTELDIAKVFLQVADDLEVAP